MYCSIYIYSVCLFVYLFINQLHYILYRLFISSRSNAATEHRAKMQAASNKEKSRAAGDSKFGLGIDSNRNEQNIAAPHAPPKLGWTVWPTTYYKHVSKYSLFLVIVFASSIICKTSIKILFFWMLIFRDSRVEEVLVCFGCLFFDMNQFLEYFDEMQCKHLKLWAFCIFPST